MLTPEREILLESAVRSFLSHEEGSRIIKKKKESFIVEVGGFSVAQMKLHKKMILFTLGLWFPLYMVLALLRRPRTVEISLHPTEVKALVREMS